MAADLERTDFSVKQAHAWSMWVTAVCSALLFGVVAWAGKAFAGDDSHVAVLWPANGILLAILMAEGEKGSLRLLSLAYIANVIANLATGDTLVVAALLAACNSVEIACALLLMRARPRISWTQLAYPPTFIAFAFYVCLLSPLASSALAAVGLAYFMDAQAPTVFATWFMADVMGLAIVTPPALMLKLAWGTETFRSNQWRRAALALTALFAITLAVFVQSRYPGPFMIFPPLIFAAFAGGFTGAAVGVFGVSVIAIAFTNAGMGPIVLVSDLTPHERLLMLQLYLLVLVMTIFPLAAVLSERRRMELRLKHSAATDTLTGLANRARFEEIFAIEWANACRARSPISVAMIDVDYFKRYNDTYGHQRGDECLAAVARTLQQIVRRPTDLVARYGGEEFILVLPNSPLNGALKVAEAIHGSLRDARIEHKASIYGRVTLSIGVASVIPEPHSKAADLIGMADRALYAAKGAGRARTEAAESAGSAAQGMDKSSDANVKVIPLRQK